MKRSSRKDLKLKAFEALAKQAFLANNVLKQAFGVQGDYLPRLVTLNHISLFTIQTFQILLENFEEGRLNNVTCCVCISLLILCNFIRTNTFWHEIYGCDMLEKS